MNLNKFVYMSQDLVSSRLYSIHSYQHLIVDDILYVGNEFSFDEIKNVFFSMGNSKALGPDDFYHLFFKKKWDLLGLSIFAVANEVFTNPTSINKVNNT